MDSLILTTLNYIYTNHGNKRVFKFEIIKKVLVRSLSASFEYQHGSHGFTNAKFKHFSRTSHYFSKNIFVHVKIRWFADYKNKLVPESMKNGNFGDFFIFLLKTMHISEITIL